VNKSDLVSRLAARLDGDRRTAIAAVNGVLDEIEQSLARGERVSLPGFGTFDRRERPPRAGRNPATGEPIQIGASVAPVFRAGAGLRQRVSEAAGTAAGTVRTAATHVTSAVQAVPAVVANVVESVQTTSEASKPATAAQPEAVKPKAVKPKAKKPKAAMKAGAKGGRKK
jgi:DNA-binding protein HU-beta